MTISYLEKKEEDWFTYTLTGRNHLARIILRETEACRM
jgi:hypothetical protein